MASSPHTAADALALLHELQVHQIELALQAQELRDSRVELELALQRQMNRHDCLPVGCATVDAQLMLHELNLTAARMMALNRDGAIGRSLDGFVTLESAQALRSALASVDAGMQRVVLPLSLRPGSGVRQPVTAHVAADCVPQRYLVCLAEAGSQEALGPGRR